MSRINLNVRTPSPSLRSPLRGEVKNKANAPPPVLFAAPGAPSSFSPPRNKVRGVERRKAHQRSALVRRGARLAKTRSPRGAPPAAILGSGTVLPGPDGEHALAL